jgi:hypothetical protein
MTTPIIFAGVMCSSVNNVPAINTVNKGVVALIIEAKPDVMWVCPQTIREKGMALLSNPKIRNDRHSLRDLGISYPAMMRMVHSVMEAMPTLIVTMVNGGSSDTATAMKKNDPPHRNDSSSSINQSLGDILWFIIEGFPKSLAVRFNGYQDTDVIITFPRRLNDH